MAKFLLRSAQHRWRNPAGALRKAEIFASMEVFKNAEMELGRIQEWSTRLVWDVEDVEIVKSFFMDGNQLILFPQESFYLVLQGIGFFLDALSHSLGLLCYILSRCINI